jgi:hypothetical protein
VEQQLMVLTRLAVERFLPVIEEKLKRLVLIGAHGEIGIEIISDDAWQVRLVDGSLAEFFDQNLVQGLYVSHV